MTALDDRMLPRILTLISRLGVSAAIVERDDSSRTYNADGSISSDSTSHTVTVSPPQNYESRRVDGSSIREGDMKVYLAGSGLTFTPAVNWALTMGSNTWRIVKVKSHYSGASIAAFELQLRK